MAVIEEVMVATAEVMVVTAVVTVVAMAAITAVIVVDMVASVASTVNSITLLHSLSSQERTSVFATIPPVLINMYDTLFFFHQVTKYWMQYKVWLSIYSICLNLLCGDKIFYAICGNARILIQSA